MTSKIQVWGVLAGRLWWPVGVPIATHVSCEIVRSDSDFFPSGGPFPDLRTALLELASDGNLASTGFLPDTLHLAITRGGRTRIWRVRGKCWETDDVFADPALAAEAEDSSFAGAAQ